MRLIDGHVDAERLADGGLRVTIIAKSGEEIAIILPPDKAVAFASELTAEGDGGRSGGVSPLLHSVP